MQESVTHNGRINPDLLADDMPLTAGYKPNLPFSNFFGADGAPQFWVLRDIETMLVHPHISMCLDVYKAGIHGAEFEVQADDSQVDVFVHQQCEKFWNVGMPCIQSSYDYGWGGFENMYDDSDGLMQWDCLYDFHPRDTFVLTRAHDYFGVRVKSIPDHGTVDLWANTEDIPAKAFWYAHRPRFQQWYGRSQVTGSWRSWRRLSMPDGAEYVIDQAMYRFGVAGPTFRYPSEAYRKAPGSPVLTPAFVAARDEAQQYIEQVKAGAGIALPSAQYTKEQGGGKKWDLEWPQHTMNADGLLAYIKYLKDEIGYGIGVPPEVLQAQDIGSGYSGRAIPLEAFFMMQQVNADRILSAFIKQVLRPLVRWNFGPQKWEARVKSLLKTRADSQQQGQPGAIGQPGAGPPGQPGSQPGQDNQLGGSMPGGAPQQTGGQKPQLLPYTGKNGGHGKWNPNTGQVYYGSLDTLAASIAAKAKQALAEPGKLSLAGMKLIKVAIGDEQMSLAEYRELRSKVLTELKARRAA